MEDALTLGHLREQRGATQTEVAGALGTSQANVWRIEHEEDVYLSTLSRYVEALGGRLEVVAVFEDETIPLTVPVRDERARGHDSETRGSQSGEVSAGILRSRRETELAPDAQSR